MATLYELRIDRPGQVPRVEPIAASKIEIGRTTGQVQVDDPAIHDPHAELLFVGGRLTVRNTSGEGGVNFRGQPVPEFDVVHGQNFSIGGTHFSLFPPGGASTFAAPGAATAAGGSVSATPQMHGPHVPPPAPGTATRSGGKGGMGLGITSIVLGVFCPLLGLIFGIVALVTALSNKDKIVLPVTGIVVSLLMTAVGIVMNAIGAY